MEKKTLIAFVLSFAVLLAWSFLFGPKEAPPPEVAPSKEPAVTPSPKEGVPPTPQSLSGAELPAKGTLADPGPVTEKETVVETPLYRAVFSNLGPTIRSFKLKGYRATIEKDAPLIELVSVPRESGDALLVGFAPEGGDLGLPRAYQVEKDRIELDPASPTQELVLRSVSTSGFAVTQTFRFYPDQYRIDLDVEVANAGGERMSGSFLARLRAQPPAESRSYYSYAGLALLVNNSLEEVEVKKPNDEKTFTGTLDWMAYEDDYFISAVVPEKAEKGVFKGRHLPSGQIEGSLLQPAVAIEAGGAASARFTLFLGPRDLGVLKAHGMKLDRAVYFGWTDIIARPLLYALRFFNNYLGNYGLSIILLTILVKILFWPLTHKSYKSMKEMQKIQPIMAKLREKYKNNREQLNREMMGLYKTYKVNPMSGCLPMVIQIPVFFALFRLLGSAIELRHAPFTLWIDDLSAPDRLFHLPFQIPFMSPPSGIPVLTLLMGVSMFIQQKMTPTPGDPTQAKIMLFLPVIFTFMFINFPSGLVLYWLVNNILSIGQQYRIQKRSA
jgi:YidC/Oxa1 family membrane protein insertase